MLKIPTSYFANREIPIWWNDGHTLALLAATGFSLKAIFVKLAYATGGTSDAVDAITLLALRMGLALPAFLWLSLRAPGPRLGGRDWFVLSGLALLGYYLSSLFDFLGLQLISAGLERLILFTYPPVVMLMDAALQRRKPPARLWLAMALSYLGLLAAFWHDLRHVAATAAVLTGSAWVLLSSFTYGSYYLGTGLVVGRIGAARMAGLSGSIACGYVLGHFALTRPVASLATLPSMVWVWALAMALISTVLPIWLTARAVEKLGAGKAAMLGTLGPALTIAFGWLILAEPISLLQLAGLGLVVVGVRHART